MPARTAAAAVSEAGDVPDEDLIRPKGVAVGAPGRWVGDPLPAVVCTSSPSTLEVYYGDLDRFADADVKYVVESGKT
jgi:hypothetical protein